MQLALSLFPDEQTSSSTEEEVDTAALFEPNGRRRCPYCRRRLKPWGGRWYCMHVGCTGVTR
jgi:hypothetical protein